MWKGQVLALGVRLGSGWRQCPAAPLTAGFRLPLVPRQGAYPGPGKPVVSLLRQVLARPIQFSSTLISSVSFSNWPPQSAALPCLPPGRERAGSLLCSSPVAPSAVCSTVPLAPPALPVVTSSPQAFIPHFTSVIPVCQAAQTALGQLLAGL